MWLGLGWRDAVRVTAGDTKSRGEEGGWRVAWDRSSHPTRLARLGDWPITEPPASEPRFGGGGGGGARPNAFPAGGEDDEADKLGPVRTLWEDVSVARAEIDSMPSDSSESEPVSLVVAVVRSVVSSVGPSEVDSVALEGALLSPDGGAEEVDGVDHETATTDQPWKGGDVGGGKGLTFPWRGTFTSRIRKGHIVRVCYRRCT